jgi:F-type H+-transporting ATPase subunit delta
MFPPERWANAFVETCGRDLDEGFSTLKAFMACAKGMSGLVRGSLAAAQLETMLRTAVKEAGFGAQNRGAEFAVRFTILLVRKNQFRYRDAIIAEIEKLADRMNGVTRARVESVTPLDEGFKEQITGELQRRTGAKKIVLGTRLVPDLLGGYRLFIGTNLIDTSLREQLRKMAADLQTGVRGND